MLGKPGEKTDSAALIRARYGVYLALSALSLLLNGTFLIVICKSWKFVKRRRITYHVTNLALADSMVGASTFSHYIAILAADGEDTVVSSVFTTITWTASLSSLLAVCLMAIERAVCFKKPHTWNQILPLKRVLLIMASNWVVTLALAILLHFYQLTMMFTLLVLFYVPIFVTAVVYMNIYVEMWRVKSNQVNEDVAKTRRNSLMQKNSLMQRKIGSFVLILTLILLVTVSPSFLTLAVKMTCELFELNCTFIETVNMLTHYFYMLEITNFVVNPILYVWRISLYRQAFWKMFGRVDSESSPTFRITIDPKVYSMTNETGGFSRVEHCDSVI